MALGAARTARGRADAARAALCTVLLCCSPVLVGSQLVTLFPAMLTLPAGGSATFFCNVSMESISGFEYSLNWYKETNHSQPQKIAEISRNSPNMKTAKYLLTNHTPAFKIEILNLHQNDSGSYYCGLIAFFQSNKVIESNRSQLVVTEAPEKKNATDEPHIDDGNTPDYTKAVLMGILLLAGAVVLFIFGYLTVTYRRGNVKKTPSENTPTKEEKPPVVSVSTVDYGVLEFQRDQYTQAAPEMQPTDQTEYATIIFPEEKPVTPERGKKKQKQRGGQVQLQPC
ncbi:programmed cell death protein 1 [Eudromia elegans]